MKVLWSPIALLVVIALAVVCSGKSVSAGGEQAASAQRLAGNNSAHAIQMEKEADFVPYPPKSREYVSPAGAYVFTVETHNDWAMPAVVGELTARAGTPPSPIWSRLLPQPYGPRFVVVSDSGAVLMVDEWNNVKSQYAILLYDRSGEIVAQYDFDQVHEVMGVDLPQFTKFARHGWWISAAPRMIEGGFATGVPTAGKELRIQFATGELSVGKIKQ